MGTDDEITIGGLAAHLPGCDECRSRGVALVESISRDPMLARPESIYRAWKTRWAPEGLCSVGREIYERSERGLAKLEALAKGG